MSVESDKRPDPDLKVNIPQNNPFLRRANSPMSSPPLSGSHEDNRNSNNPFLDPDLISTSPPKMPRSPPRYPPEAAMRNMTLDSRPPPGGMSRPGPNGPPPGPRRPPGSNAPPGNSGAPGPGQAAARLLQMKPGQQAPPGRDGPQSRGMTDPRGAPPRHRRPEGERRPDGERPIRSPSEERRRRERHERRRKEREAGLKDSQGRPVPSQGGGGSSTSRSKKGKGPHLDTIDKMDSTGSFLDPFGTGYHVSGPYDATVSKQNRKLRPIDAFAADSLNMVMGGGKPTYDKHVHADARNMYGHVEDAVNDYTNAAVKTTVTSLEPYNYNNGGSSSSTANNDRANRGIGSFDATSKVEQVHGDETTGLGTSTFLEGTPAPASAMRRESESDDQPSGGLSRTRSLAQRFRNQRGRDRSNSSGIVTSPERRPAPPPPSGGSRTMSPVGTSATQIVSLSAGGLDRINESKPFFDDYDDAYERKGDAIKKANVGVTLEDKGMKPAPTAVARSVPESSGGHQRTSSNTSSGGERDKKDGFLGRMRSLRGRKKEKGTE